MSTTHDGSSKPAFTKSPHWRLLFAGLVLCYAVVGLLFVAAGRPNIDEGIFLSAAERVFNGEQLYRDFPFYQAPMLPYFYALAPPILGSALMGALKLTRFRRHSDAGFGLLPKPWTLRRLGFSYPKESREPSAIHTRV